MLNIPDAENILFSLSGSPDDSKESNLLRELKTSLDRARSETTDGYAASEASASLFFSETNSTRESSPHKQGPRIVPIQIEPPHNNQNQNGFQRSSPLTSTPKLGAVKDMTASSSISRSKTASESTNNTSINIARHASDISHDRTRPLIQRRLRYDSENSNPEQGSVNGSGFMNSAVSNASIDSLSSRPITPGFPTVPPTPIFGQPAGG